MVKYLQAFFCRGEGVVLLLSWVLAVLFTWPVLLHPASIMLKTQFAWSHLWVMDLVRDHLLSPSPDLALYSYDLGWPAGGFLVLIGWLGNLLYLPLGTLFSPVLAFNAVLFVELMGAAWFMYQVCRRLGAAEPAAVVGGLLFGYSPYILSIVYIGENPNLSHGLFPLSLLCLIKMDEDRVSWPVIPAALALVLLTATTPYYGIFAGMFLLVWGPARVLTTPHGRVGTLLRFGATAVLGGVVMIPLFRYFDLLNWIAPQWLLLRPASAPPADSTGAGVDWLLMNATLRSLVLPGKAELGEVIRAIHVSYLGVVSLGLALGGSLLGRNGRQLGWWALLLGSILIMMGPILYVESHPYLTPRNTHILLPLAWLQEKFPLFQTVFVPYRAALVATLCLSVVVARGLTAIMARLSPGRAWGLMGLCVALTTLDTLLASPAPWPITPDTTTVPAFYQTLGQDRDTYAIYPTPFECRPGKDIGRFQKYFYYQTFHGKRLPFTDRLRPDRMGSLLNQIPQLNDHPLQQDLCDLQAPGQAIPPPRDLGWFRQHHIRYLILHTEYLEPGTLPNFEAYLAQYNLKRQDFPADGLIVWTLAEGSIPPDSDHPPGWLPQYFRDWRIWLPLDRSKFM